MTQTVGEGFDKAHWDPPLLRGLTEVEFIRDILSQVSDESSQGEIQGFEARILKKHLRKTIIDYTVRFASSTRSYIGLYRESDQGLRYAFSVLKTLRSNGFGKDSRLMVPNPVLYVPAISFLLMEKANGEPLREILAGKEDPLPYIRGAAQWLAKLHGSEATLDGNSSREEEVEASQRFARAASWLLPRFESEILSISKQMIDAQRAFPPAALKPIHGDYHAKNIISSSGLTTVIDLEEAKMGDPAFDLGYFIAQTKMTHGTGDAITQATAAFLQEYQEKRPTLESDFARRVAVFEAQTYLQRIYHTNYLLALKPDLDLISVWLNECETSLQGAESHWTSVKKVRQPISHTEGGEQNC